MESTGSLVDVCMITYNHEKFLRQAIDSVLAQKTTFPFRIIIGEDISKDNTRAICDEYATRYPGKVIVLPSDKKYGAIPNFARTLLACEAKYTAICEGDDYWSSTEKLQKQVDYMEQHPEVIMSSHNTNILLTSGKTWLYNRDPKYTNGPLHSHHTVEDYIIKDFFHTTAIMYRRAALKEFPDWYKNVFGGDYFLVLIVTMNGPIHFLNESLSVYRINEHSVSHYNSRFEIFKNFDYHLNKYNEWTNYKYDRVMRKKIFSFRYNFYYYHPKYFKKVGFFFRNFRSVLGISTSVISPLARFKMLIPTVFLKSKVNLFSKKQ